MNIIEFVGSPRKTGNTARAVGEILTGASSIGTNCQTADALVFGAPVVNGDLKLSSKLPAMPAVCFKITRSSLEDKERST